MHTARTHVTVVLERHPQSRVTCHYNWYEALPFQNFHHVSDCSVQCGNQSRNLKQLYLLVSSLPLLGYVIKQRTVPFCNQVQQAGSQMYEQPLYKGVVSLRVNMRDEAGNVCSQQEVILRLRWQYSISHTRTSLCSVTTIAGFIPLLSRSLRSPFATPWHRSACTE